MVLRAVVATWRLVQWKDQIHGRGWELLFSLALKKCHLCCFETDRTKEAAGWEEWLGRLCVRQRCRLGEGEAQKVLVRGQQGTGLG